MRVICLVRLLLPAVLLVASCGRYQGSDESEKGHPTLRKARELAQTQDLDGAEGLLREFLRRHPDFALAHLQLGMVYQSRNQSIPALYHFQAYLAARPNSEKADILRQVVEDERRRLAAQVDREDLLATPAGAEVESLRQQLAETGQRLAEAEVRLQQAGMREGPLPATPPPDWARERLRLLEEIHQLRGQTASSSGGERPSVESTTTPEAERTYTVQRGDTLSSIAQKMYGRASEWTRIYEANRDRIPNKNVLSRGEVLKIP